MLNLISLVFFFFIIIIFKFKFKLKKKIRKNQNLILEWNSISKTASLRDNFCSNLGCIYSDRIFFLLSFYSSYFLSDNFFSLSLLFCYLSPYNISMAMDDLSHVYSYGHLGKIGDIECNVMKCKCIQRHNRNRTKNKYENEYNKFIKNDKNKYNEITNIMIMDKIHTFLVHFDVFNNVETKEKDHEYTPPNKNNMFLKELKRTKQKNEYIKRNILRNNQYNKFMTIFHQQKDDKKDNKDDKDNKDKLIKYHFGNYVYYPHLNPSYPCLNMELLNNKMYSISNDLFQIELNKAKKIQKKAFIQTLKANDNRRGYYYGIQYGDSFPLISLLCILLYTNIDDLCTKFRMSFYNNHYDHRTNKSVTYYYLGLYLMIGVEYFGESGSNDDNVTFYHGLNQKMTFDSLTAQFATPTSVTPALVVAEVNQYILFYFLHN